MNCLPVLPGVSIRLIQQLVSRHYKLSPDRMTSPSRLREFAWPRQIAMALAREFTTKSLTTIGYHFGGRDHTTVIFACRAVEARCIVNDDIRRDRAVLRAVLNQIAPKPAEVNMLELYAQLGLQPGATKEEIKAAHRRKVQEHHPDRGGDKAKFQAIQLAYDTLKDDDRRKRYEETGETSQATNDPAVHMLGMIVENLIGQMLDEGMPIETVDMRQIVVDAVAAKIRELAAERAKAERQLKKAADLSRRWKRKRKAKGPDLIGETIRRRERDLAEAIKRGQEAEGAWKRAARMLEDYEYEFDDSAPRWSTGGPVSGFHFINI